MTELKSLKLDKNGFLLNPEDWSREVSEYLATEEGIALTRNHWSVIKQMRSCYKKYGSVPILAQICRSTGLDKDCVLDLFKQNPLTACKIAGLPMPTGDV